MCLKWRILCSIAGLAVAQQASAYTCPPPPQGPQDIRAMGYYSDAAGSIRDPQKYRESHALTKPFEDFTREVDKFSDQFLKNGDPEAASCAIGWLDRWAQDHAMLGTMVRINNNQAEYTRKWTNAALAIDWNKVRQNADTAARARIDAWLKAVSRATLDYWRDNPKAKRNNHYYWTGVGVMATAVATDDQELLSEARHIYDAALDDIQPDGTLDYEMRRGIRALHYHNFAVMPLMMMAEMSRKTGQNWFALQNGKLSLLAGRVISGLRDPAWFGRKADAEPQIVPPAADRGWMLIYRARVAGSQPSEDLLGTENPGYIRNLGGALSLMLSHGTFDPIR